MYTVKNIIYIFQGVVIYKRFQIIRILVFCPLFS